MLLSIFIFIVGVFIGFAFLGIIASAKQADLWAAIKLAAYKNDPSLCKKILNNQ